MIGLFYIPFWDTISQYIRKTTNPPEPEEVIVRMPDVGKTLIDELMGPFGRPMPRAPQDMLVISDCVWANPQGVEILCWNKK